MNDNDENYNDDSYGAKMTTKQSKRRYFPSNIPQTKIKNAQTGVQYDFETGSAEQRSLFKAVDTTGTCDENGFYINKKNGTTNPNSNHLFYDTPEQCMRHLNISFERNFVETWHNARQSDMIF